MQLAAAALATRLSQLVKFGGGPVEPAAEARVSESLSLVAGQTCSGKRRRKGDMPAPMAASARVPEHGMPDHVPNH